MRADRNAEQTDFISFRSAEAPRLDEQVASGRLSSRRRLLVRAAVQALLHGVANQLVLPPQLQLREDVLDMVLDGLRGDEQLLADLWGRVPLRHQPQHL